MVQHYTAVYTKQGKWYLGWVEELPGVNTQGKTLKEAKENMREALALVLEANKLLSKTALRGARAYRERVAVSV
ncbi:MAG: type II toxin-antitoxin system HicB family antitoxin [Patescibacteria group bacterium]